MQEAISMSPFHPPTGYATDYCNAHVKNKTDKIDCLLVLTALVTYCNSGSKSFWFRKEKRKKIYRLEPKGESW